MLAADFVLKMVRDGELHEVAGYPLVSQDRPRVLDGGADVEVRALRIVGRDEVEAFGIGVVDPRRIHEAAGARRLESRRELPDREVPEILRQRQKIFLPEEADHLVLAALVRLEELALVLRDHLAAGGIRVGHGGVGEQGSSDASNGPILALPARL